jgi:XRE family transcriptional regulator, regulator of sulfur utilization
METSVYYTRRERKPRRPGCRRDTFGPDMPKSAKRGSLRETPIPPGDEVGAAELAARVAGNLREHRRRRDMSLDQLAQRTGVSRAGLSQIETRKTNPSIGVLWKIASGLGIPFSELIGEGQHAVSVLRRDEAQVLRSTDRKFESRPLMPASGNNQIEVYELRLAARARHASEPHGPGTRELVIVLSGSLRMVVGEYAEDLAAGDSMLFNANSQHAYENNGNSEGRYQDVIIYPLR